MVGKSGKRRYLECMDEEKWEGEGEGESGWILGWEGFDGGLCMLV